MTRLGLIVRLLMLVACLVPFTSVRQVAAAFALAPVGAPAPSSTAQQEEDDNDREEPAGKTKGRAAHVGPEHRPDAPRVVHLLAPAPLHAPIPTSPGSPPPADPFRNGLGTPYRC